jgi:flagellar motor switch protein FliM
VDVELRVEAGAVDMKVSEVLDLKVGDVVRLKRQADKGVVVYAGDVPTYVGTPGRNGNARAVQVRGAWERGR